MKKLIMIAISLGLTASCSFPVVPNLPKIDCEPIKKLTKAQTDYLQKHCSKYENGELRKICPIPREMFIQIFENYQKKAECLEQYEALRP